MAAVVHAGRKGQMRLLAVLLLVLLPGAPVSAGPQTLFRPDLSRILPLEPEDAGQAVTARYLGTSTLVFTDGETTVLIDGFLTRPPAYRLAWPLRSRPRRIAFALERAGVSRAQALFVAHGHYDHAMDIGAVALATGARIHGFRSVGEIARGQGVGERFRPFDDEPVRIGTFEVSAIPFPHAPDPRFPGEVGEDFQAPAWVWAYREGVSHAFVLAHGACRIVVIPSAGLAPEPPSLDVDADVVFLSVGGVGVQPEGYAERYWTGAVRRTSAERVIATHWDDFTRGLDRALLALPRPADDVGGALTELTALARQDGRSLTLPSAFAPIGLCGPRT